MSLDPQIFILFSLGVDLILCVVLLFLWLTHSDEQHALAWAVGQMAMAAGTANLFLASAVEPRYGLAALLLTISAAAYWAGMEIYLCTARRKQLQRGLFGFASAGCLIYISWLQTGWGVETVIACSYGLIFLWIGWRLLMQEGHYRFFGVVFILRGIFNLANGFDLVPLVYEVWMIWFLLVKAISMLCLIHAVQEKIQQRYSRVIDSLSKGFLVYDRDGVIHSANERCALLFNCSRADKLVGTHVADWLPGISRARVAGHFTRFAAAKHYPYVEMLVLQDAKEQELPVELIASPHYERGQLHCMMMVMDISERKKKDDQLYQAAYFDPVTGLRNRYGVSRELARLLARALRNSQACAVLFIDIDKFKRVNDSFGHVVGDQLLVQMAKLLRNTVRADDVIGRFGGDEFVVVMPDLPAGTETAMAASCGQHILAALHERFDLAPYTISVSASIGVSCYPQDGDEADILVRHADIAMHDVKKSGRGELRFFDTHMGAYARDALVIDGALRSALDSDELLLVYQPIVCAYSGRMEKVEALLRWHSAKLGVVAPDRFIAVAEDSDLIIELGGWVLAEACRQLDNWRETMPGVVVSVNVSARQLLDPAFLDMIERLLARYCLAPHQLEMELTERVLISDGEQVRIVLGRLQTLGVSLSLDDFGTGYSSLSYLTKFQFNTLKIDRTFVTDMVEQARSSTLVATVITMGHSLGLKLVAEGVETAVQANALASMGCHYLQGYHVSRPVAPTELVGFYATTPSKDAYTRPG